MIGRKHILVVEDDVDIAEMLLMLFDMEGYSSEMARTGTAALALLEDCLPPAEASSKARASDTLLCPDLILLDLQLPDMNGEDIIHHLNRSKHAAPPVIVLTARRQQAAEQAALEIDAAGMFLKPFEIELLLAQIKTVLA